VPVVSQQSTGIVLLRDMYYALDTSTAPSQYQVLVGDAISTGSVSLLEIACASSFHVLLVALNVSSSRSYRNSYIASRLASGACAAIKSSVQNYVVVLTT